MPDIEMIRVYYQTIKREYAGTDETDHFDIYRHVHSKLEIAEMPRSEYNAWSENINVSYGEEGGSVGIFVITDLNGNIISEERLIKENEYPKEESI